MTGNSGWLLALDLSVPRGTLVLEGPGGLFQRAVEGEFRTSQLFVAAGEMMSSAGIAPRDIGIIGVGRGPGSFTGVRVGVMAAKALALVLGIPLVAPDSLEVAAMGAEGSAEAVLVAQDARRGEVYYGLYRLGEGRPVVLEGPSVARPEVAVEFLSALSAEFPASVAIVGTGVEAYPEVWPRELAAIPGDSPAPESFSRLCRHLAASGETADPMELLPLYIRRPDAKERFAGGEEGRSCG